MQFSVCVLLECVLLECVLLECVLLEYVGVHTALRGV